MCVVCLSKKFNNVVFYDDVPKTSAYFDKPRLKHKALRNVM